MKKFSSGKFFSYLLFPLTAFATAICYELFIFPNDFAPAGIGGVATMVQYLTHGSFNAGYLNLLVNIPLLIVAWRLIDREFVIKTALFAAVLSISFILFDAFQVDFGKFIYHTESGTSNVLAPIAAGVINGALYGICIHSHGCTGGTDVIAACIRHFHPEFAVLWISFALNAGIAAISYFVYDFMFEPVICCLVYCFVSTMMGDWMLRGRRQALKFEIISEQPEPLAAELMEKIHHGVTVVQAEGMYTHAQKSLIICIVNKHQVADVERIIRKYPGAFAYIETISNTIGQFIRVK